MILKLVDSSNPIIKETLPDFDFTNPPVPPNELARDMVETLYSTDGLGLACNQVGLPYRMFVMAGNPPVVCFNPVIVDSSTEEIELDEGCLTYPGLSCKISRPRHIKVRFTDFTGEVRNEKYTGMSARVFQHELSHLNGETFFDHMTLMQLEIAVKKANKRLKKMGSGKRYSARQLFSGFSPNP